MPYRSVVTISSPSLGGTGTNTWHARPVSLTPPARRIELDGLMEFVRVFYVAVQGMFPAGTTLGFDGEWSGVGDTEGEYETTDAWQVQTAGQGSSLPPANAICVNWRGESGDRSRRGRTFLGPCTNAAAEGDGTVNGGTLSDIRGAANALVDSSDTFNNGALGVWSRQELVFRDFVGASVRDQFAVLRSRRD